MKRRSFVQKVISAGAISTMPSGWFAIINQELNPFARPELLSILDDPQAVNEIGKAYLRRHPAAQNPNALIAYIDAKIDYKHTGEIQAVISRQIKSDFAHGNTIQLNGWILSQTEAQQCALYSLTHA